jgi:hypothetical protein
MTLARSRRRAFLALSGLAVAQAATLAAPALAADDKSTISSVMELVGVTSDPSAAKIDYSERPKLVLPPRVGELPPPREAAERPNGWPSDASTVRHRNSDRFARVPNAAPEEKKPGVLERALSAGNNTGAPVMDEPGRRMLTEPPPGYRRPTKDLAGLRDPEAKKGSWWNPITYFGGNEAPAAAPPQQKQAGGGESEGFLSSFRMPRFVLKDPDKE